MKKFKKLSREELKLITAGGSSNNGGIPCTTCGGSNNGGTTGNGDDDKCGNEPQFCQSAEWTIWYNCKVINNTTPTTFFCA